MTCVGVEPRYGRVCVLTCQLQVYMLAGRPCGYRTPVLGRRSTTRPELSECVCISSFPNLASALAQQLVVDGMCACAMTKI